MEYKKMERTSRVAAVTSYRDWIVNLNILISFSK